MTIDRSFIAVDAMHDRPDWSSGGAMRLFFALWPDAGTVDRLMAWAREAQALCGGRIMRPETLHMTLAFLGETPADAARDLAREARGWNVSLGSLVLSDCGRFKGPRIVWAGPSLAEGRVGWLDALYDSLWSRLEQHGWSRPAGAFRPHVTLLRNAGPGETSLLDAPPLAWSPTRCVLVASRPQKGMTHYEVLASLPAATSDPAGRGPGRA
jgi:2'-5' RNA ligase